MSRKSFRLALLTVIATFAILIVAAVWAGKAVLDYPERRHKGTGATVEVVISRGMKLPDIAQALAEARVIDRPSWFRVYAMHRGLANKVRAGKYQLTDNMTPHEVLDKLVEGVEEVTVLVTIPEGKHLREVIALVAAAGVADAAELERVARDPAWLKRQGIAGETVEGYLFPESYRFKAPTAPEKVLEAMVKQHRIVYAEVAAEHARSSARLKKQLGWSDRELVIMASIVEKETGDPDERPTVASVFYNRLLFPSFTSRRLETDPTIRYGCTMPLHKSAACQKWDPSDRLHEIQLQDSDNPYNTYRHANLPPGPISNPGRASLAAAMAPADTEFLYFVAKNPRQHVFSKTYEEHKLNVKKYIK